MNNALTLNYGVRYERPPAGQVQHRHRRHESELDAAHDEQLPAAPVDDLRINNATVLHAGFGMFRDGKNQIQPIESDRISSTLSSGVCLPG